MQKRRVGNSGKTAASVTIDPRPQYTPGSELSAEERAQRLHDALNGSINIQIHHLKKLQITTARLLEQRLAIMTDNPLSKVKPPLPEAQILAQNIAFIKALDATLQVNQIAFKSLVRGLNAISELSYKEFTALKRDWFEEKTRTIDACQREPMINMNWTDIEGLISTPNQRRQAERAFETEAGAVDGVPISEERKSKLEPKPKPKARGKRPVPADTGLALVIRGDEVEVEQVDSIF